MSTTGKVLTPTILLAFALAGCHSQAGQSTSQPASQAQTEPAQDPADANLAPAGYASPAAQNPPPPPADQSAGAPAAQEAPDQAGYENPSSGYDETSDEVAPAPPPPIPDYEQPPSPGDDYEWTPGYWSYAQPGYYWVPGAWILAPYVGALWTPGYWGFDRDRYHWHPGYWGPHVGFYGGVNYGYGYDGDGYEGGYWRGRDFYYNRAITRVNPSTVHHTYDYRVTRNFNDSRVSYNGGKGGLHYQPTRADEAARQERHFAPLASQRTNARDAMQNRAQFASENHGRPQQGADNRPMNDGRAAPAARPEDFHPSPSPRAVGGRRPLQTGPATRPGLGAHAPDRGSNIVLGTRQRVNGPRPSPPSGIEPQPGRPVPESRRFPNRQNPQPNPDSRPNPNPGQPQQNRESGRPQPPPLGQQPRPQPQNRQPQSRPEQQRPETQSAPRPESRPQEPRQETQQGPRDQPHPQGKPGEQRPQ